MSPGSRGPNLSYLLTVSRSRAMVPKASNLRFRLFQIGNLGTGVSNPGSEFEATNAELGTS